MAGQRAVQEAEESPGVEPKRVAGQDVHAAADPSEYEPALHATHPVGPPLALNLPAAQPTQDVALAPVKPGAQKQSFRAAAPCSEVEPAGHACCRGDTEPNGQKKPGWNARKRDN